MSVPKVKCPSCGSEWAGPVVFCGECGAAITTSPSAAPGDRVARVPPAPPPSPVASASTPVAKPGSRPPPPVKPVVEAKQGSRPPPPVKPVVEAKQGSRPPPPVKPVVDAPLAPVKPAFEAKTGDAKPADPTRPSRPSDLETRRTVMGMPAVASPEPAKPEPVKPARRETSPGGKKGRKGSIAIPAEPTTSDETEKLLEALDAGFDTITRPSELPVVPITPSLVPDLPVTLDKAGDVAVPPGKAGDAPAAGDAPTIEVSVASAPFVDEAARRAQHESDMAEVRALFAEMASAHARPLRDFMIEVSWGDPTREWIDVAVPAAAAIRRAAEALEMPAFAAALDGFTAALELAVGESAIGRDAKELLLGAYGKLVELMPGAFALEGERGRREPIIVRALLLQVPGVQKVALDKICAAGLTSLEMLYAAGPRELAETTGLDEDVAARIHDRFQRYRREIAEIDPGKDRAAERAELEALVAALARAHEEHERLAKAWTSDAAAGRARARKERGDLLLQIDVLLARMGEVDRQKALEKVPFAQKIRDLTAYLDEAKQRAARP